MTGITLFFISGNFLHFNCALWLWHTGTLSCTRTWSWCSIRTLPGVSFIPLSFVHLWSLSFKYLYWIILQIWGWTPRIHKRCSRLSSDFLRRPQKFAFWRLPSKRQNHEEDCANFCGLLRKAELYKPKAVSFIGYQFCPPWHEIQQLDTTWYIV